MAKQRIWLVAAVLLVATAVYAEDAASIADKMRQSAPVQSKIFVGRPILRTGDVDKKAFEYLQEKKVEEENKKDEQPMVKIEPAAKIETGDVKTADESAPESADQAQLPPILPFFNGMSPFLKSIISSSNDPSSDVNTAVEPAGPAVDGPAVDGPAEEPSQPRGILRIVFMKAVRPVDDSMSGGDQPTGDTISSLAEARSSINMFLTRFIPQRFAAIFGGNTDPDSKPMRLIGGDDVDRNYFQSQQLLGGSHDIDRFRPFLEDSNSESDDSDENVMFNRGMGQHIIIRTDSSQPGELSDDVVRNYPTNKCVMSFMRLKASAYYRTVVHLLFFSGIILLVLFMIILTIRVYRRRRALRFYHQNMNVATISYEDMPPRKTANGNLFLFRLGSLRNSYAQKQAAAGEQTGEIKSSLLIQSPPAYEQVISPSDTKLGQKEDDAKSLASLPAYHEALLEKPPKSSDV